MGSQTKVVIAGGGIGGLTLGIALHRAGIDVQIYERVAELKEIGAAVSLFPNATNVLKALGLLEPLLEHSYPIKGALIRNHDDQRLAFLEVKTDLGTPGISLIRPHLLNVLVAAFPGERVHLNHAVKSFEQRSDKVIVHFESGERVEGDALVGCDGVRSAVRKQQLNDGPPIYAGYTSWRGETRLAPGTLREGEAGETMGAGVRAGIWPVGHGLTSFWVGADEPENTSDEPEGRRAKLLRMCKGWHAPIEELIANAPTILKTDLWHRKPIRGWSRGRVTLLGDAAHPMTPNMGQGACMAIEDALVLSRCLERYPSVPQALLRYEQARFDRTKMVVQDAWDQGVVGQWKHPLAVAARTLMFKHLLHMLGTRTAPKYYNYDATRVEI
jgi:2-polyprenyl-6-methoxyphenol hydroxylase-like FAD-dependent oxidoreductase